MDPLLNTFKIFDSQYYFWILLFANINKIHYIQSYSTASYSALQSFTNTNTQRYSHYYLSFCSDLPSKSSTSALCSPSSPVKEKDKKGMVKKENQHTVISDHCF